MIPRTDVILPRRTKLVATLGPATDEPGVLAGLVAAGLDVARINCSHGTADDHRRRIQQLRAAAKDRPVAVLVDIQGPKLRVAALPAPLVLAHGETVVVVDVEAPLPAVPEGAVVVPVAFDPAALGVSPGERVLLDDGRISLMVEETGEASLVCRVARGGTLTASKGVNLPDTSRGGGELSAKDRADIVMAAEMGAEWVAVSFVASPSDIERVRALLPETTCVMAKIERPAAVANFAAIAAAADAVMIARGDLGVETAFEELPLLQRELTMAAHRAGVPVVTATEMLDSMVRAPRPTRAEVTDVANAVLEGTDAVMLSAETAIGADPVGTLTTMARIVTAVERSEHWHSQAPQAFPADHPDTGALAQAAVAAATALRVRTIGVFTETGRSPRLVAAAHPDAQVVAFCPTETTWRRCALYFGVTPVRINRSDTVEDMLAGACARLVEAGLAKEGEQVVFLGGTPNKTASASFVTLQRV